MDGNSSSSTTHGPSLTRLHPTPPKTAQDDIVYSMVIEEFDAEKGGWLPYKADDVQLEFVMLVKHLLYTEKYTIEGAKQQLDQRRKDGGVKAAARQGLDAQTVLLLEQDLLGILQALDSDTPTSD